MRAKGRFQRPRSIPRYQTAVDIADTLSGTGDAPRDDALVSRALDGYPSCGSTASTDGRHRSERRGGGRVPWCRGHAAAGFDRRATRRPLYQTRCSRARQAFRWRLRAALDRIKGLPRVRARPAVSGQGPERAVRVDLPASYRQADVAARPEKAEFSVKVVLGVGRAVVTSSGP